MHFGLKGLKGVEYFRLPCRCSAPPRGGKPVVSYPNEGSKAGIGNFNLSLLRDLSARGVHLLSECQPGSFVLNHKLGLTFPQRALTPEHHTRTHTAKIDLILQLKVSVIASNNFVEKIFFGICSH